MIADTKIGATVDRLECQRGRLSIDISSEAAAKVPAGRTNLRLAWGGEPPVYMRVQSRRRLKNGSTRFFVELLS